MMQHSAVTRAAVALDALRAAHALGDWDAVARATADTALWWTVAEARGATAADVRAARAGDR